MVKINKVKKEIETKSNCAYLIKSKECFDSDPVLAFADVENEKLIVFDKYCNDSACIAIYDFSEISDIEILYEVDVDINVK